MICGHGVLSLYDLWAEMKAGHLDWVRGGGQKDQIQPSLNGRGLLGFSYGLQLKAITRSGSKFGSICRIVTLLSISVNSTQFYQHTNLIIFKWNVKSKLGKT